MAGGQGSTRVVTLGTEAGDVEETFGPRLIDVTVFEIADADQVLSGIAVDGDRLYFGASRRGPFGASGAVYCLDRNTGKRVWAFDNGGELYPVFSTPAVGGGRVYFGEGLHENTGCRLYCLDAATGTPAWEQAFPTASHTEGTPRVMNENVYFSAGEDGLYCVNAGTGAKVWQFAGTPNGLHIDTPPAVHGNRLFAGSGYGTHALLCLDADTGVEVWRTPTTLRSFGPPLVLGDRVVYGLGTGNLTRDTLEAEANPAGAVVCVNAADGSPVWRFDLPRSVHTPLAADAFSVYATSRDGVVYCLTPRHGRTPVEDEHRRDDHGGAGGSHV